MPVDADFFEAPHVGHAFHNSRALRPAVMVENPVHNVRLWHTGMTRSPGFPGIRAPWSHRWLRPDGQAYALLH